MCPAVRHESVFHACFIISDNNPHRYVEFVHENLNGICVTLIVSHIGIDKQLPARHLYWSKYVVSV